MTDPLLRVEQLSKKISPQRGLSSAPVPQAAHPLAGVSFDLNAGEIVALVGESGAGKTALARALAMLARPDSGKVIFEGRDLVKQSENALRPIRRRLQVLFSDPRTALNPQSFVSEVMLEPLRVQGLGVPEEQNNAVRRALREVGLNSLLLERRLTALSAGERQRVALARLLTLHPALIICDDPARTLPALAADQFFKLMLGLRQQHGTAFLWLVSDPQWAAKHADRLGVLCEGRLVEMGTTPDVIASPRHPYSRQWFAGTPTPAPASDPRHRGCYFHSRCLEALPVCRERVPEMFAASATQTAVCFLYSGASPES